MTGLLDRAAAPLAPARRRRVLPVLAGVLVLVVALGWLVGFSSVLGVRTVTVSGEQRLSAAAIEQAAAIRRGAALARLDTGAIRERISALPAVRSVSVRTSYPSTVRIAVTERVAVGYRSSAEGVVLVDPSDIQFATQRHAPAGLPQLELTGDQARSSAAAAVAGALPASFARVVSRISAPTPQTVTLTLSDGRTVLWGGTDRSAEKAALVPVLVHQPGQYFDVSDPSAVISRGGN